MAQFGPQTEGTQVVAAFPDKVRGGTCNHRVSVSLPSLTPIVLITGPSPAGIGSAAAYALAQGSPDTLLLLARSQSKYQPVIDKIHGINSTVKVKFFETDLSSMGSVRHVAAAILADKDITSIDAVINNAGVIVNDLVRTEDGFEPQFAINHLSHFLLTNLLMPRLLAASSPRVVNVSSFGHRYREPTFEDPHFSNGERYNPALAYAQSKGAQILFSVALNARLADKGLRSFAVMPGDLGSGMYTHMDVSVLTDMAKVLMGASQDEARAAFTKTMEQGCATGLTAALADDLPEGTYMEHCQVTSDEKTVAPWALDLQKAELCWRVSEEALGEEFSY